MRQTFTATIRGFESKRYYKDVGLPYSIAFLTDVATSDGHAISGLRLTSVMPYTKSLHALNPSRTAKIQFTAELDLEAISANRARVFKRPLGFKILN